jgi:hypothetical protein
MSSVRAREEVGFAILGAGTAAQFHRQSIEANDDRGGPGNRARTKEMYGVDFFPAEASELGSGQPFLRFFQKDRQGRERGVLMLEISDEGNL